jgi:hypothetical protein
LANILLPCLHGSRAASHTSKSAKTDPLPTFDILCAQCVCSVWQQKKKQSLDNNVKEEEKQEIKTEAVEEI